MLPTVSINDANHVTHHNHLHDYYNTIYKPLYYGAEYDGATDDASAFQDSIDNAPSGGLVDFSGPGTALINSSLTINKSLTIIMRAGLIQPATSVDLLDITSTSSSVQIIIDGLRVTSDNTTFRYLLDMSAGKTAGILRILNCISDRRGIRVQGTISRGLFIKSNDLGDGSRSCLIVAAPTTTPDIIHKAIITNNNVLGTTGDSGNGLITLSGVVDTAIVGFNHVKDHGSDGYDLDAGSRRAVIVGNIAENCLSSGMEVKGGSRHDGNVAEDLIIGLNQLIDAGAIGLSARTEGQYVGNIINCPNNEAGDRGIYVGSQGVTLASNYIVSGVGNAIEITGAADTHLIGNRAWGNGVVLSIVSGSSRAQIENNYFNRQNQTGAAIGVNSATDSKIRHNRVIGGTYSLENQAGATGTVFKDNDCSGYSTGVVLQTVAVSEETISAFTDNDATPSVLGGQEGNTFTCDHTLATNITDFDDGLEGQTITVHFTTGNATLVDGTNIFLDGSSNYNAPAGTIMQFQMRAGDWYELSRINT